MITSNKLIIKVCRWCERTEPCPIGRPTGDGDNRCGFFKSDEPKGLKEVVYIRQSRDIEGCVDRAMKHFEDAAPADAYTVNGVRSIITGMGLASSES
jgi:hypothetical protein